MDTVNDEANKMIAEKRAQQEQVEILRIRKENYDACDTKNADKINDNGVLIELSMALETLCENRPKERGERSRRYAVTITEMEKVYAYFKTFIIDAAKEKEVEV